MATLFLLKFGYKLLEGHASGRNLQTLLVIHQLLFYGRLRDATHVCQILVGELETNQHAELVILLTEVGISLL